MEKFYRIISEEKIDLYNQINQNRIDLDKAVKEVCNSFGIESTTYYLTTSRLIMELTDNDRKKFKSKITKDGAFKKNSDVHKMFKAKTEGIGRIEGMTSLDFNLFIHGRYRFGIFKWEDEYYLHVNSETYDFNDKVEGLGEVALSRYYEILAESEKTKENRNDK